MIVEKNRVHKCSLQNKHPLVFAAQGHIHQRGKIPSGPQSGRMVPQGSGGAKFCQKTQSEGVSQGWSKPRMGEAIPSKEKDEVKEGSEQCIPCLVFLRGALAIYSMQIGCPNSLSPLEQTAHPTSWLDICPFQE